MVRGACVCMGVVGVFVGVLGCVGVVGRAYVSILNYAVGACCSLRHLLVMLEVDGGVNAHELFDVDGVVSWGDDAVPIECTSGEVVHYLDSSVAELYG